MNTKKLALYGLVLLGLAGCTEKKFQFNFHKRTPQEAAIVALKSDNADERYKTLVELSNSPAVTDDWAVKAMTVIARTDPSSSVRALAVYNLGGVHDPRVLATLVEALEDPDDRVRTEAARSFSRLDIEQIAPDDAVLTAAQKSLVRVLVSDPSVDVRINAAKALEQFKNREVFLALVAALRDQDFAVRNSAEFSLIGMTGRTFQRNPNQWIAWSQQADDPFLHAGQTPEELVEPRQNLFQRTRDGVVRFYLEWQGPSKK